MTKHELVNVIAESGDVKKETAGKILDAIIESIADTLKKGEEVKLIGLGNFKVNDKKARKGRNPQTGEEIKIKASKAIKFKVSKSLKESVNEKESKKEIVFTSPKHPLP